MGRVAELGSLDNEMIVIRRVFLGLIACALVMIASCIGLWLTAVGGLGGMMDDDAYPMSLLMLPVIASIFSGIAFWIAVFPFAHLAKWFSNKRRLTLTRGGMIAAFSSASVGVLFGFVSGGVHAALIYGAYLGTAALVFWLATARV